MGTDLRERFLSARRLFELADSDTGLPTAQLGADGPIERLTQTEVAQPAVVVTSLAAPAVLREHVEDEPELRMACAEASQPDSAVEVANLNAPGQLVVSGTREAITRLGVTARVRGARRLLPLNVGGPFHSVYMRPAAEPLARALEQTQLRSASIPVVLNTTAQPTQAPAELRRELEVEVRIANFGSTADLPGVRSLLDRAVV